VVRQEKHHQIGGAICAIIFTVKKQTKIIPLILAIKAPDRICGQVLYVRPKYAA